MLRRFLVPALAPPLLAACGAGSRASLEHRDAFAGLHERLVQTQGLRLEGGALHEHLAGALVGEALTEGFLQAAEAERRRRASATAVHVDAVAHEDLELLGHRDGATDLRATWVVTGRVTHGDHMHRRATRFEARYRVVDTPAGPRIADERASDATRLPAPLPADGGGASALELLGGAL